MPDFARETYQGRGWFAVTQARFKAVSGSATADVLPARAKFMQLMGYLAGKWPHTLSLQPGGSSRALEEVEKLRIAILLREFRSFLELVLFGDRLENVAALDSEAALLRWMETRSSQADFPRFLAMAYDLDLHHQGRATDKFMSVGAYQDGLTHLFAKGVWDGGLQPLDITSISEDVSHSWMQGDAPLPPTFGETLPQLDKVGAYSWCKAPRLGGRVVETGALARQMVEGHLLVRDLVARHGGSVTARVVARLLEIAQVLPAMEGWLKHIQPGLPFCLPTLALEQGQGVGLIEAARGSLGHWLDVRDGKIHNYQIVAPTTWNFSPRDAVNVPGALEQALVGVPAEENSEDTPVTLQHIIRSFDPCMVCTVH
jgi:hydrogenase large subunit